MPNHLFKAMMHDGSWVCWDQFGRLRTISNGTVPRICEYILGLFEFCHTSIATLKNRIVPNTISESTGVYDGHKKCIFGNDIIRYYDGLNDEYYLVYKDGCDWGVKLISNTVDYFYDDYRYKKTNRLHDLLDRDYAIEYVCSSFDTEKIKQLFYQQNMCK